MRVKDYSGERCADRVAGANCKITLAKYCMAVLNCVHRL